MDLGPLKFVDKNKPVDLYVFIDAWSLSEKAQHAYNEGEAERAGRQAEKAATTIFRAYPELREAPTYEELMTVLESAEHSKKEVVNTSLQLAYVMLIATGAYKADIQSARLILNAIHTFNPTFSYGSELLVVKPEPEAVDATV